MGPQNSFFNLEEEKLNPSENVQEEKVEPQPGPSKTVTEPRGTNGKVTTKPKNVPKKKATKQTIPELDEEKKAFMESLGLQYIKLIVKDRRSSRIRMGKSHRKNCFCCSSH